MTVETNNTIDRYVISGTGPYGFTFRIFDEDELQVVVDTGDLDPTPLTINSHYTVSGVDVVAGGTVTLVGDTATLYAGDMLDIRSNTIEYQPTSIRNQGSFLPEIHEDALDRLSRQVQDLRRILRSALRYPDNTELNAGMSTRAAWANRWVYCNANGEFEPASAITPQALTQSIIGGLLYPATPEESAVTVVNAQYPPGNVLRYGVNTDPGTTNMTAAFTAARTVTGGRYHVPTGDYLVDPSPSIWGDSFTADGATSVTISAVNYNISNAYAGRLRYQIASAVKTDHIDAPTGNIVRYEQNSQPGTATGFYRVIAFQVDGHWAQVSPVTNGGSVDLLWQRSTANADPAGNRFNFTFDEANDRLLFSMATTASGAPTFDSFMQAYAGITPQLLFPAVRPQFNQGLSVKQRAAGGFECQFATTSSTLAVLQQVGGTGTTYMTFRDNAFGFFGSSGTSKQTISGSRGGNAALASLLTALAATGLITDGSSA